MLLLPYYGYCFFALQAVNVLDTVYFKVCLPACRCVTALQIARSTAGKSQYLHSFNTGEKYEWTQKARSP